MMRLLRPVIRGLLVAALTMTQVDARTGCAVTWLGSLPLRNDALFLHIPVEIGSQTRDMIIDTGSEGSLITPKAADELHLPVDPHRRTVIYGPDGRSETVRNRITPDLRLGRLDFGAWSFPLGILPNLPKSLEGLSGLIGADMMQDLALEFDAPRHRLRFWRYTPAAGGCDPIPPFGSAGIPNGSRWIKLEAHRRGLRLNVVFILDGVMGNALIDSGARSITLSRRFANHMGVSNQMLAKDRGGITSGVDLNARRYYWHHFGALSFASDATATERPVLTLKAPVITVSDIDDDADMLLGADIISRHDVWVSFQTSSVFIR